MSLGRAVLSVAPHPDDELLGAPATLMALRDAGWRVVNLACSLGRTEDRSRRRAELIEACGRARFELELPDDLPAIGRDDDLPRAQQALVRTVASAAGRAGAELLVGPSPHDGHHGHEVVGRAIRDAVRLRGSPMGVLFWGLWADLPLPNLIVPFDAARLREIQDALAAHAGELARNRYDRLLEARAAAAAVLGPERVFGFGTPGTDAVYAELLTAVSWSPDGGWTLGAPRQLDPADPLPRGGGPAIDWWLEAPSTRARLE